MHLFYTVRAQEMCLEATNVIYFQFLNSVKILVLCQSWIHGGGLLLLSDPGYAYVSEIIQNIAGMSIHLVCHHGI